MTEAAASASLPSAAGADELLLRVARQRLANICAELQRSWLPVLGADAVIAWLVGRNGAWAAAAAWFVVVQAMQLWRRHFAAALRRQPPADPRPALRTMVRIFGATGLVRAALVALAWWAGTPETWTLLTMLSVGLGAGAVATVGGEAAAMRVWSYPVFGALALGWLAQLSWIGAVVAPLLAYFHYVLVGYVRLLGQQGRSLIENALDLERERDRVREAHLAASRLADELRAERDRVTAANESKTRFLASASHDLRQPLYALSLNASSLSDVAARLRNPHLDRIEQGMRRALVQCRSLLDQLLDISQLEARSVKVHWSAVDLGQLLLAMRPQYEALAAEKGLQWRFELGPQAPPAWTDATQLERLLGNLLHNAIKFTESGEVGVRIDLPVGSHRIAVEVFDTGPGIRADEQERIFEEFYQVGNPSRDRTQGLGLGLSIVRRLATLLHAQVALRSVPGRGSCFRVELPVAERRELQAGLRAEPEPSAPMPLAGEHAYRVLVIDDEPDLLDDLTTLLTIRGWSVVTACSAAEARERATEGVRPDVVLADYRLAAGATGLQAIHAVHEAIGPVPAVIVTGDTAPQRIAEASAAGYPVLHKPLAGKVLERALLAAIESAAAS